YIITGVSICLYMISSCIFDELTINKLKKQIKSLDEEILKDEKECTDVDSKIARIQVTLDKIEMSNKFTEEKIAILKDVISQLEETTKPKNAQKVVQVQPAKGVRNSDNVQFSSSSNHKLA
ncbi:MAG: hypothetical protein K2L98_01040, partial [Bacilli bacterium]|nr:hypothetical protein [Bacilli bacterium]